MLPDEGDQAERQFWIGLEFRVCDQIDKQPIADDCGFGAMDSFPKITF